MIAQTQILTQKYLAGYRGLTRACWFGIGLGFFESTLVSVFYYLSYYFVSVLHIPVATAGLIISSYGVGAIFGGIIAGKLADRFGANRIASLSLLLQSIGYLNLLLLTQPVWLIVNLFVVGMAAYGFLTSNYLCVLHECSTERERLQAISLLAVASNLGLGIAGFLMGVFANYGFQPIFAVTGSLLFAAGCYLSISQQSLIASDQTQQVAVAPPARRRGLFIIALICVLSVGAIVAQLNTTYAIYLQAKFPMLGIAAASYLFALNSFLVVLFQTPITHVCRTLNKLKMLGMGSFLIGMGLFILTISNHYIIAVLSCVVFTLGEILFFSSAQLICYQAGGSKKKGQSLGLYRMTYAASRVLGPAMGGIIYAHLGCDVIWYASGLIGVCCLGLCLKFKNN